MQRSLRLERTSTQDAATMSALEIVKVIKQRSDRTSESDRTDTTTNKKWWQKDFVTIEPDTPDTNEIILTVSRSKALIESISQTAIKHLKYAGYSVVSVQGETKIYPSLYIPLSQNLKWQGIQTILENCGYEVTVIAG